MKITELSQYTSNYNVAKQFLQDRRVVRRSAPICPTCNRAMTEIRYRDGTIYRCPSHKENKLSPLHGSFLSGHKISMSQFIFLAYFWSRKTSISAVVSMTKISERSAIQWYSYFRDACSHYLVTHPQQIGGIGVVIEIDECLISRRKYNRGRLINERWVFGGIDPQTNSGFLQIVPDRSAATLLPLVEQYIAPGSIIISDQWAAYNNIAAINVNPPFQHRTVNHSIEFVNANGDTTNHIEVMWNNCKRKFKQMSGTSDALLPGHLDEFIWRQRFGRTEDAAFDNILAHISEWYPTP